MKKLLFCGVALALAACSDSGFKQPRLPVSSPTADAAWEVGPILDGKTKSINVPSRPAQHPEGFAIDIPHPNRAAGHVHYVTFNGGTLAGKSTLTLRYRVEMGEGVELRAASPDDGYARPAMLTLYFQRCNDDWLARAPSYSGRDGTEAHRWWSTFATVTPLLAGDGEITVSLNDPRWSATQTSTSESNPAGFAAALADTCRIGFTLGGGDGYGHGVYATGPARLIIKGFEIN